MSFDNEIKSIKLEQCITIKIELTYCQIFLCLYSNGKAIVEIPLEAEGYLSHGLKVKEIADLYSVHRFGCWVVLWTVYRSAMGELSLYCLRGDLHGRSPDPTFGTQCL